MVFKPMHQDNDFRGNLAKEREWVEGFTRKTISAYR